MNKYAPDSITIDALSLFVRIGCLEEERAFPRRILLDLEAMIDLQQAGRSGQLEDTVCYVAMEKEIKKLVTSGSWRLLEELGHDISTALFKRFEKIQALRLKLSKHVFPDASAVSVALTRERE